MHTYSQTSGIWTFPDGSTGTAYSGHGPGVNNPAFQNVPDVGPIPQGRYTTGPFFDDPQKGPLVCHLIPDPANIMFGRSGMMLHGDAVGHVGEEIASEGCIVAPHPLRQAVEASGDTALLVTA